MSKRNDYGNYLSGKQLSFSNFQVGLLVQIYSDKILYLKRDILRNIFGFTFTILSCLLTQNGRLNEDQYHRTNLNRNFQNVKNMNDEVRRIPATINKIDDCMLATSTDYKYIHQEG